jgi:hypothetical protein
MVRQEGFVNCFNTIRTKPIAVTKSLPVLYVKVRAIGKVQQ